jgi:5-methyltetrahydrofolate--homocysteine methyltransferase
MQFRPCLRGVHTQPMQAQEFRIFSALKGIAGEDAPETRDLFHQKYRGSRYSFGYPPCPNLEDQTKLFALLRPEPNVGVGLTSGFLLVPEQSTSAMVAHHPGAKYFAV